MRRWGSISVYVQRNCMRWAIYRATSECIPNSWRDEVQLLCNSTAIACAKRFMTQCLNAFLVNEEMRLVINLYFNEIAWASFVVTQCSNEFVLDEEMRLKFCIARCVCCRSISQWIRNSWGDEAPFLCISNAIKCVKGFIEQCPNAFLIKQERRLNFCAIFTKSHALRSLSHNVPMNS